LISGALASIVLGWWLLIGGVVVWLMPATAGAHPTPSNRFAVVPAQTAHIYQPGVASRPVVATRAGLDTLQRTLRETDEQPIENADAIPEWIVIGQDETVRIVAINGVTVQVELLEGAYAGRFVWLEVQNLSP
jgi:hypothetical protein